jgi:O-acetyl-ADP-ribose deacetylase (regulator of RNase III)
MLNETIGDIWSYAETHRIVIPTNILGVMGAGLALQAKQRYPGVQTAYQSWLAAQRATDNPYTPWCSKSFPDLILAPTKRHWKDKSRLKDVADVLEKLSKIEGGPFALPEMGCGLGGLSWAQVHPFCQVFVGVKAEWVVVHPYGY